jgi:hypothetical protein
MTTCRLEKEEESTPETSWLGGCGLDSTGSGQEPVAGCCECGDEPSGSCATELVSYSSNNTYKVLSFEP